ncbi:hypothetical protein SeMB42_g03928 [Synchytrium endobioticum]|uniref:Dolichyl-diphosphooligosaccharide-protein glycosyltransferase subunit OST5 n=1 Tax=Synchytrium endobioticum TaxID=286115 RepID=A0A507CWV1_9FUNG|nr:hypothetical protein SeLEV6574_g04945 [Synchytrium endobioticum]TPX45652.1 hypothetical protein SeMB42_g03928 [Synchytrium endobioticum]
MDAGMKWADLAAVAESTLPFAMMATLLLIAGFIAASAFLMYEVTSTKSTRKWATELGLAALSSLFLGFGTLYLFLALGIYV